MISISFSGMDGAGKSTQCKKLVKRFLELGVDVEFFHMGSDGKTVGSQCQGLPIVNIFHRTLRDLSGKGISRYIRLSAGLCYYLADAWVSYFTHKKKYRGKLVIYDRYYYDFVAIFASNFPVIPWWVIRFVKILPRCHVSIIMSVPPNIAKKRRPEHSYEQLERYFILYQSVAEKLGIKIIDGAKDPKIVEDQVNHYCQPITDMVSGQSVKKQFKYETG